MKKLFCLLSFLFVGSFLFGMDVNIVSSGNKSILEKAHPVFLKVKMNPNDKEYVQFNPVGIKMTGGQTLMNNFQKAADDVGYKFVGLGMPNKSGFELIFFGQRVDFDYLTNNNITTGRDDYKFIQGDLYEDKQLLRHYVKVDYTMKESTYTGFSGNQNHGVFKLYFVDVTIKPIETIKGFDWSTGDRYHNYMWLKN